MNTYIYVDKDRKEQLLTKRDEKREYRINESHQDTVLIVVDRKMRTLWEEIDSKSGENFVTLLSVVFATLFEGGLDASQHQRAVSNSR